MQTGALFTAGGGEKGLDGGHTDGGRDITGKGACRQHGMGYACRTELAGCLGDELYAMGYHQDTTRHTGLHQPGDKRCKQMCFAGAGGHLAKQTAVSSLPCVKDT